MALVLHLGGVGEWMRLIWEWSAHGQESGDLHSLPTVICRKSSTAWHSNSSLFPNDTGTSAWRRWLGKVKTSLKISERNTVFKIDTVSWATQICCALVYQRITPNHQIHQDCRGQTGSLVTFGQGAVSSSSNKMKCNTKSSTEKELIPLADKLADVIWMWYFIECQWYDIDKYIVFQDNVSVL